MELKTIKEFRCSVQQLPAVESIHPKDRSQFLTDAYKLAKTKYQNELLMETMSKAAKASRSSTIKFLRVAKHIMNALKQIEEAKKATPANWPKLMLHLQVLEAADLLRTAYDDLGFLIGMDIAAVHPHHRTGWEKQHRAIYENKFLSSVERRYWDMPARRNRFDYLLVAALSSRLDKCRTSTDRPLRPIERYRIITRVFLAALKQTYPEKTVESALGRTSELQPSV
jgi:predicted HAD superfamily Cof-like phosphohydrolase